MEDIDVISSVLKYLDFHELCVAERVNSTFQHCVRIELLALKHVDLAPISLENHGQIITKLDDYCPQLQRLSNCLEFLFYFPLCFSNPRREQYLPRVLSILQRLAYLDMFSPLCDVERVFKPEDCLNILVNTNNLQHLGLRTLGLCDEWRDILLRQQTLKSFSICGGFWVHLPPCVNLTSLKINFGPQWKHEQCEELYSLLAANQGLEHLRIHIFPADQLLLEKLTLLRELKTLDLAFSFLGILNCERDKVFRKSNIFLKSDVRFDHLESIAIYSQASKTYSDFIMAILARSPALKRCSLEWEEKHPDFYPNIFTSIICPEQIECFTTNCRSTRKLHIAYINDLLPKMTNLKHLHVSNDLRDYFCNNIPDNFNAHQFKFLDLSAGWMDRFSELLRFHCSAFTEGVSLCRGTASTEYYLALIDIIFEQCPNLRYFAVDHLPIKWFGKLSSKLRSLHFLSIDYFTNDSLYRFKRYAHPGIDDLVVALENLPNLRVLLVARTTYRLLLQCKAVKRLCIRQRLYIDESIENWNLYRKWIEKCCGSKCVHSPFWGVKLEDDDIFYDY